MIRALAALVAIGMVLSSGAQAGRYVCAGGKPASGRTCPDGSPAMFQADEIRRYNDDDRRKMMDNINRQAKDNAAKWQKNRPGLNQDQVDAIRNMNCLGAAAANSDVRCVHR